ncbi:MAG: sigma-70 family RNA polymerase sigma factor [Planctomycetota bacterium]
MTDPQTILDRHGEAVWCTAYRLLGNREDAHDCYQETFVAALRRDASEPVRHWPALLRRIATCRAMDRLRQRYAEPAPGPPVDRFPLVDDRAPAPSDRLEQQELLQQVRVELGRMPERQAEAFWLRHMEQMSPDEIATQMDVSPANARQLVHRAADRLRVALAEQDAPEQDAPLNPALNGEPQ